MAIRHEVPNLDRLVTESCDVEEAVNKWWTGDNPNDPLDSSAGGPLILRVYKLWDEIETAISEHKLDQSVHDRFAECVERDLQDPKLGGVTVEINSFVSIPAYAKSAENWFKRTESNQHSALDQRLMYIVLHQSLVETALSRWGANPRVVIDPPISIEHGPEKYSTVLKSYGFPDDQSTWHWVYETVLVAEEGLRRLDINFRLSDFVRWDCEGGCPPNMGTTEKIGPPSLFEKQVFGARIIGRPEFKRLEACKIWKSDEGFLVSPLWEYLQWGGRVFGEDEEISRYIGRIGEGLDAAILAHDPEYDPEDAHRVKSTLYHVYNAGEAKVRLRVALEISPLVTSGRAAAATAEKRGKGGGESAISLKVRRISDLLDHMEGVARRSPDMKRMGDIALARLAFEDAQQDNPSLWTQGAGQIENYLVNIKCGEVGDEMKVRYEALFPPKPLKRFTKGRTTA